VTSPLARKPTTLSGSAGTISIIRPPRRSRRSFHSGRGRSLAAAVVGWRGRGRRLGGGRRAGLLDRPLHGLQGRGVDHAGDGDAQVALERPQGGGERVAPLAVDPTGPVGGQG